MCVAVPDHVDKPKQEIPTSSGYPAKAVLRQQGSPVGLVGSVNS